MLAIISECVRSRNALEKVAGTDYSISSTFMKDIEMPTDPDASSVTDRVNPNGIRPHYSYPEVENFYRFLYENGMRREGKILIDLVQSSLKKAVKQKKARGSSRKAKKS